MKSAEKILITGATGCLGLNLAKTLCHKGYQVYGLGRNTRKGVLLENMGAVFHNADIRSHLSSESLNCDCIVHSAALSSPSGSYQTHYAANVVGTKNVIALARRLNAGLIHISTPSIYFAFQDQTLIQEDAGLPKIFASHYTHTKYEAEKLVMQAHREGLKTVILRPRGILGEYDTGIVPRVLRIARSGFFPLVRGGTATLDLTYVGNVSYAIDLCIEKIEQVNGEIFNITNDSPRTLRSVLDLLFHKIDLKVHYVPMPYSMLRAFAVYSDWISQQTNYSFEPPITPYTLGLIAYSQTLNIDKAKQKLGYKPPFTLEEGIDRFLEWRKSA